MRYALRALVRTPWYSATVIGVVALGLTLASTVFAIVDGVLFKPLPYPHAEQLFVLSGVNGGYAASVRDVGEWAAAVPEAAFGVFQHVFELGAIGEDRPREISAAGVDRAFLSVAGVSPVIGGFQPDDFEPSGGPVPALISYALWQREFGGRTDIIGARLAVIAPVNSVGVGLPGVTVAGVLPGDFIFPSTSIAPDVILPIALTPDHARDRNWSIASALVRVPPDLAAEVLGTRVSAVTAAQAFPAAGRNRANGVRADSLTAWLRRVQIDGFRSAFDLALAVVLLACVNVAGLAVARRRARSREIAVHVALGAGRWALMGLTLREVLLLIAAGWVIAAISTPAVLAGTLHWMPASVAMLKVPVTDWRVLTFAAVAAAFAIATTSAAELRTRPEQNSSLGAGRSGGATPRRGRMGSLVIGTQVGLASVLAVSGSLVVASMWLAWRQDPGYDTSRTIVLDFTPGGGAIAADRFARVDAFIDACRHIPGVDRVGAIGAPFLHSSYLIPGLRPPAGAAPVEVQSIPVTGDVFEILGLTPFEGRLPIASEAARGSTVVVISERIARAYWPGQPAIGQVLSGSDGSTATVIGVVREVEYGALGETKAYGQVYSPYRLYPRSTLLIRTAMPSETLRTVLREAPTVGGGFGITRASTMTQALAESIGLRIFRGWLFGGFATTAVVICGVGVLGIIAMTAAGRTREMGVRLALGSTRTRIISLILVEQILPIGLGLVAGGLASVWTARFVRGYLYQFTMYDTRLWFVAAAVTVLSALVGGLIPAIRASRVDPIHALRED